MLPIQTPSFAPGLLCAALRTLAALSLALAAGCAAGKSAAPAGAAGPKPPPAGGADQVARFYPLAVGNEWTYEITGGGGTRRDTVRIVGRDGAWFLDDHRGRLRVDAEGLRDADRYLLRAPLEAGAKWRAVEDLVVQKFEIVSTEAAEVTPAGTFTGCVQVKNEQPLSADKGRFVTVWTYAPGVGLVRMRTSVERGGETVPQLTLGLVEYRLVK